MNLDHDEAKDRFDALAECVDALVFVTDLSMRMVHASSALERDTGFTLADFQFPQADNPFIHRDDADRVARFIGDFAAGDARVSGAIENRFLDRWGRTHRYRSVISKVRHGDAPALLFVCSELGEAVAGLIRSMHGVVRVDSEPGRGTSIEVTLPAARRGSSWSSSWHS